MAPPSEVALVFVSECHMLLKPQRLTFFPKSMVQLSNNVFENRLVFLSQVNVFEEK